MTEVTEAGAYTLIGGGASSCGTWVANRRQSALSGRVTQASQAELEETAWVVGFLSGVGFIGWGGDDPLDGMDGGGVWAWIDNYCAANPIKDIRDAAEAFYHAHPHR
jgi:hypothetical protein